MAQNLTLGGIQFQAFEVPEHLPNLFGVQKLAIHDFAGGQRTIQTLGNFPHGSIEWSGILFDGDAGQGVTAMSRAQQINRLCTVGKQVQLIWGAINMPVVIESFEGDGRLQQMIEYKIKVVPVDDNTASSVTPTGASSPESLLNQALNYAGNVINTPASGGVLP